MAFYVCCCCCCLLYFIVCERNTSFDAIFSLKLINFHQWHYLKQTSASMVFPFESNPLNEVNNNTLHIYNHIKNMLLLLYYYTKYKNAVHRIKTYANQKEIELLSIRLMWTKFTDLQIATKRFTIHSLNLK